jgi:hypothetical protein
VARKLILIVIDGLTPSMFEAAVGDGRAPALSFLAEQGTYSRAISTFPSLTPVCLSSLATGAHPDVHRIPHLVWYDRERARLVEYGSSFGAVRGRGNGALAPRHDSSHEPAPSGRARSLSTKGWGCRADRGGDQHHLLPGTHASPPDAPGLTFRPTGRSLLLLHLFESDPTGRAGGL